ncbi:phosphoribosyl-ATP diphosphatase [Aurantimonas sp. C2-6-R+9]|uniref:phosphoribosyl-ATP diphosphatase n=1 Tax=unclassified Aurantimonas TaxID=2638230 RepID=UPI002E18F255|nr:MULTISPECIES: phosphoribosyl-ATP diphosphatase [unclassified Aurantimonas]MEC5292125.1 phosphoribosyl-ATP diphosphatase [Aurantimonas sp. C2-3-R2]MEC5382643.1 phosphoribosyl-ATP diphosphatase [Aurantimonas sp. C2-6-R+9]MEC5413212.1 phosphoribosyl-ATP diphosphatase [Aurantimonas sp. C2-4-R8]
MTDFTLADLETIVAARATSEDSGSYTASLVAKGIGHVAKKLGEEATETVIAAVSQDDERLTSEAADLLYHLMVALRVRHVPLAAVMDELQRRTAQTGIAEKAGRPPELGQANG